MRGAVYLRVAQIMVLGVLGCACLGVASAHAGLPFGTGLAQRLAAQQFPAACHATVQMADTLPPNDDHADAYALPSTCTVLLSTAIQWKDPQGLCVIMTHEYGHLAGLGHSADPSSIMYPRPTVAPLCDRFFLRLFDDKENLNSAKSWVHGTHGASRARWSRRVAKLRVRYRADLAQLSS
jgi:hypothetical protein